MEKANMHSLDMVNENIKKIGNLFPECVTETVDENGNVKAAIDFEKLQENLSHATIGDGEERYQFTWPGKREAIHNANAPTNMTLRPCKEESVDFDNTKNLYIEGDNLEVLKLLQENYLGKVKMIYIDPPYNTGNDFVYNDDFKEDTESFQSKSGMYDEDGNMLLQNFEKNTESNGRFHTDWLNMMYPRLKIARNLLGDDGVIFISIDDNEQGNLQKICNDIFGENNFIGQLIHQRAKGGGQAKHIVKGHDYILVYSKKDDMLELARKKVVQKSTVEINGETYIVNDDVVRKVFGKYDKSLGDRRCFYEELEKYKGKEKKEEIEREIKNGNLFLQENKYGMHTICKYEKIADATSKLYSILKINPEEDVIKVLSEEGKKDLDSLQIVGFSYPKPVEIIRQIIDAGTDKKQESYILDFFSGSATTAHAVMQLNAEDGGKRKYICVQLPEATAEDSEAYKAGYKNICEIGKERIRRAGKKIKEEFGEKAKDLDIGFRVLKLAESNMKDVYYSPAETLSPDMFDANNVKEDRTPLDLLFQVLPECNLPLSSKIEERTIEGKTVYFVNGNYLVACFDEGITEKLIKSVIDVPDSDKPYYFYMRNLGLESDKVLDNFEQLFVHYSPSTKRKVI